MSECSERKKDRLFPYPVPFSPVSVKESFDWKKNANLNFVDDCTRESTEAVLGECSALTSKENTVIDPYFITAAGFIYLFTLYFKLTYTI